MTSRFLGLKISRLFRLVKSKVLEGGVGFSSGGRLERSRVRFALLREALEEDREVLGEVSILCELGCMVFVGG